MSIKTIVKTYLTNKGYTGLKNDECGCSLKNLFTCGGKNILDCEVGFANDYALGVPLQSMHNDTITFLDLEYYNACDVANAIMDAYIMSLGSPHHPKGKLIKILATGLCQVGIVPLIDEITGYSAEERIVSYQTMFNRFLRESQNE